ncbi:MAG: hypothetical protein HOK21_15800 [Rhodospirillaceae bacterium]|jgi:hypothetical protein|nr:hypothetical protein [Rhodospirillaceae bacterium]MBT4043886.1 hypothetical protein [Rhodospirillaceae bacterium]MBT4688773.1 hypothetical protein [Rhodospirillaceae bacterium]MBT5083401.1 hypothetical protein [Rhodospirillaceae bacterium]MBT5525549.1 hypothetical protein [Rhodospirillaceae bacterium]
MRNIDSLIKSLGDRLGLPRRISARLVKKRRLWAHPIAVAARRRDARALASRSAWRGFVPNDKGFALAGPDKLPGLAAAVAACQRLYDAKQSCDPDINKKPFFFNLLDVADLEAEPALLDFALSDAMIESASDYIGMVPRLHAIGLYVSPVNDSTMSSQMFHLDGQDFRQLKCFVNVHDVGDDDGPFSFLPADKSDRVANILGHYWGDGRLEDDDVFKVVGKADVVALTGGPGTAGLVDPSRCLHFGSRARENARIVFMFHYTPWPDARVDKPEKGGRVVNEQRPGYSLTNIPDDRGRDDALRRLVLARR